MKRLHLTTLVFFSSLSVMAQKVINAKVINKNNAPIPFATVKITSTGDSNTSIVRLTDNNGIFKVQLTNDINQSITISEISHETLTQKFNNSINTTSDTLTFVLNKTSKQLAGVTILGKKKLITQKIDRLVMNISGNPLTAGKSSLDVFSMAPGVFVSNGNISINGNVGTRIMVNNKILQLTGDDLTNYLNNLRAEDIESIEVIAHPPAEYESNGTGGMLNIIMKKQNNSGMNGSLNAGYTQGRYAGTNESIRINFKDKKVSVFANYSFNKLKSYEDSEVSRDYANHPYEFSESAKRVINENGNRVNTGIVYDLSDQQYIAVDYTGVFSKNTSLYTSDAYLDYSGDSGNVFNTGTFPTHSKTNYNNIGINYHASLDQQGSSLQVLADYTKNSLTKNSAANSSLYNSAATLLSDTAFRNTTPSIASIYTTDVRYTRSLKNNNSISVGAKAVSTSIDNSARFESFDDGQWMREEIQDYSYNYKEKIIAGYLNFSGSILKTEVKLGVRGEYTDVTGDLKSANPVLTETDYFNLFPSLFAKKKINAKGDNYVSLYYGRRLLRPSYSRLNPYESYINNYSVGRGNPYLTPSFSNTYEAGITLKNKYTFKATYQLDKDLVSQFIKVNDDDPLLWIYTFENYGKNRNIGLSANIPVAIAKWWNSNTNLEFRLQKLITADLEISENVVFIQTNHDFKVSPKISINLNGYYMSNLISGNLLITDLYTVNVGAQRNFFEDKLLLRATVSDPFYSYKINGSTVYKDYSSKIVQRRQSRTFNLSLTYNFDVGKSFKLKKLQKSSKEEEGRL